MTDDKNLKKDVTLVDPSIPKDDDPNKDKGSDFSNEEKEGLLKELKKEREARQKAEADKAALESKLTIKDNPNPSKDDIDLEQIVEGIAPVLVKKGFITQRQKEDEDRANQYARDLKDLSTKYDGSDGRPKFDPALVAEHAKQTGIFNLEAAYRDLNWNELVDFEKRQSGSDSVVTEKPGTSSPAKPGERVPLTQDFLKKRLAEPDGKEWYEKNRDKIMAAMAKGQL